MKLNTLILLVFAALICVLHVSCGTTLTPAQKRTIALKVGQDVLADAAAGATVLLTTGNGGAAGLAMTAQAAKNLPGLQATVGQVLQETPVTAAKNPVPVQP